MSKAFIDPKVAVLDALLMLADATDRVWLTDIAKHTPLESSKVSRTCAWFVKHGVLKRIKRGFFLVTALGRIEMAGRVRMVHVGASSSIKRDTVRARLWRLLRIRKKLSVGEAVAVLCDGTATYKDIERCIKNVREYLRALVGAGHVAPVDGAPRHVRHKAHRYFLVRDTGPLAPVARRSGGVYDPNDGKHYAGSRHGVVA